VAASLPCCYFIELALKVWNDGCICLDTQFTINQGLTESKESPYFTEAWRTRTPIQRAKKFGSYFFSQNEKLDRGKGVADSNPNSRLSELRVSLQGCQDH
jgi:hypothetical protein